MQIIHHGGKDTVTGSCHELKVDSKSILVDCGQFQGRDSRPLDVKFPVAHIQALIVTHAHIDHIGRIPWLLAAGFNGPILCTAATAELIPLMLDDGLKLNLGMNKVSRGRVLELVRARIRAIKYDQWHRIKSPDLYCRFQPAGHVLGSAYVEIKLPNNERVVFSGDLGPSSTPLLPDPIPPSRADYLVIESTYGNKLHESIDERSGRLKDIINRSLLDGGTILIPAFSVGRTQELLFDIENITYTSGIDARLPIILDSPMAAKITRFYRRFKKLWGKEAKRRLELNRHPLAFEQCMVIDDYRQHKALVNRLASTGEPAIVIAASGMCEGGRITEYLKALLPDNRTDVLFSGYQANGTLGHALQLGSKKANIEGFTIPVNAQIHTMSGYSAHADQQEILSFIERIYPKPKEVHLVHGEVEAKSVMRENLFKMGFQSEQVFI